jgi:hypothetical protein
MGNIVDDSFHIKQQLVDASSVTSRRFKKGEIPRAIHP